MENFVFTDSCTEDNNQKEFNPTAYYHYVQAIITDFFKVALTDNVYNKNLLNLLQNLEECEDVYQLESECEPWYWAICIIHNTFDTAIIEKEVNTPKHQQAFSAFTKAYFTANPAYLVVSKG